MNGHFSQDSVTRPGSQADGIDMPDWVTIERKGGRLAIVLSVVSIGDLEAPLVADAIVSEIASVGSGVSVLEIDLSTVEYLNSMGLGSLILAARAASDHGIDRVRVVSVSSDLVRVFSALRLQDLFEIEPLDRAA